MSKKPYVFKRILAYIVDILVVSLISSFLTLPFSSNEDYNDSYKQLYDAVGKYKNGEITEEEYLVLFDDINYELSRNSVDQTIVIIAVTLLYFVVLNYYNDGQTLGKKLMKIRIVSVNKDKLSINNYLIRTLVGNTVLSNIVTVVLILSLSRDNYMVYNNKVSTVFSVLYVLCFVFVLYRSDGRGLHDLLASTVVVNDEVDNKREIEEASVIKEVDDVKEKVDISIGNENLSSKTKNNKKLKKDIKKTSGKNKNN